MALHDLRKDYTLAGLLESDLDPDPIAQFRVWFTDAQAAKGAEPNAMTLATADASGNPAAGAALLSCAALGNGARKSVEPAASRRSAAATEIERNRIKTWSSRWMKSSGQ